MSTNKIEKYGKLLGDWKIKKVLYENRNGTMVLQIYKLGTDWEENCALKVVPIIDEYGEWNQLPGEVKKSYLEAKRENCKNAEKEVRLMYTMRGCSNIVSYYDYMFDEWSEDNRFGCDLLIRMELLDCLRTHMHAKRYSEKEIINIGIDICKALVNCHKKDIIHRDIKPENIFINEFGNYLLGDFGISRIVNNAKRASTSTGTVEYMAPEQVRGNNSGNYGLTVDMYSLGLTLYELANGGKLPFAKSIRITQAENALRLSGKRLPVPNDVGEELASIILKACEYDVSNRYQSADEMIQDLIWLDRKITEKVKSEQAINRNKPVTYEEKKDAYATVPAGVPYTSTGITDEYDKDKIFVANEVIMRKCETVQNRKIVVMGIGGCGNNVINRYLEDEVFDEIEMVAVHTDKKALDLCNAEHKLLLGENRLKGLGVNANPDLAISVAKESINQIKSTLEGVDILFLICGLGGGTGTGVTPIIAETAKKMGILTVALVTTPFRFEHEQRIRNAQKGVKRLTQYADTAIIAPNDLILEIATKDTIMIEALKKIDSLWSTIIRFVQLISKDKSNDIIDTLKGKGLAEFSYGIGNTIKDAAEDALNQSWIKHNRKAISEVIYISDGIINEKDISELSSIGIPFHVGFLRGEYEKNRVLLIAIIYTLYADRASLPQNHITNELKIYEEHKKRENDSHKKLNNIITRLKTKEPCKSSISNKKS